MLALAWSWHDAARDRRTSLSERLASSLCAGIGGHAGSAELDGIHFAYRSLRSTAASARAWRPATLPSGVAVIFHGYFDNADAIAAELEAPAVDQARLYGLAVERWGDDADRKIIGEYCAVIASPGQERLRLSRSPLRAPPLCYHHSDSLVAVASVPRAIFATGVEQRLNDERVADSALINFGNSEASWFQDIARVPIGHIVELERGKPRALRKYYDLFATPKTHLKTDAEIIARASELLDEGVRACLRRFRKPGATLSGGLDTPQVAVRVLKELPEREKLPTFTFHPEDGYDGRVRAGMIGDERPLVEAFAAMHPRVEPHFTANEGYGHDHRWNELFHLMGGAPSGLCNVYVYHGLFAGAARAGCDVLLFSEFGNNAFSDKGAYGYVEYFLTGRWRQLWRALRRVPSRRRSIAWRFVAQCILPLLPTSLWRMARRAVFRREQSALELMQPLSRDYRARSGADKRLNDFGFVFERYQPRNRRHAQELLFANYDSEGDEIYQAFEQLYGVPQRDPTAHRPLVEFCFGLPVRMFMRDGELRWLAKEMARGIMPEEQRENRLNGRWDADWHLRIGRRRKDYLAELDRLQDDEKVAAILDLPRLRAALEEWPEETQVDLQDYAPREFAVPRGLLTARFIRYVEGHNQP